MIFPPGLLGMAALVAARQIYLGYHFKWSVQPILALVAGLLILIRPKLLNFIVAIYLILIGIMGILHLSW